eukprot:TRINITY_DN2366_c0_g1_i1.p2 TRINITY_DN2366_c0_g1~~TRINITY_DN2366_c0_g1_i1.p2  ORF type:complete len:175 (-),score=35.89 TRINITY_DN2366_c0_g1_i1:308-832(-)
MLRSLVGSEMCIRDRYQRRVRGPNSVSMLGGLTLPPLNACGGSRAPPGARGLGASTFPQLRRPFTPMNNSAAFIHPIPGYRGYQPRLRLTRARRNPQDLCSTSTQHFRRPRAVPILVEDPDEFKMKSDKHTDYRAQAHRYTGRASGFVKDQEALQALQNLKPFKFNIQHTEFGF